MTITNTSFTRNVDRTRPPRLWPHVGVVPLGMQMRRGCTILRLPRRFIEGNRKASALSSPSSAQNGSNAPPTRLTFGPEFTMRNACSPRRVLQPLATPGVQKESGEGLIIVMLEFPKSTIQLSAGTSECAAALEEAWMKACSETVKEIGASNRHSI
ncbi:unnamed protein product [Protopolystoma xenopodis]|uniref:Uncharacterized protein n=1 Tax=Protopolystoma xenopodis TaxID=117903 RepID=A0A3S5CRU6_9PLAT|nr:unnamed protein product [Protopolystoma xenopodis]